MYKSESSILDEVMAYNIYNCKKFLGFINEKYSKNKKPREIRLYVERSLSSLNLVEKFSIEATFKLKSTNKLDGSLEKIIKNEANDSHDAELLIKNEVRSAFKKIRKHLRNY